MHILMLRIKNSFLGRVLCVLFMFLCFTPFVAHYYLSRQESLESQAVLRPHFNNVIKDSTLGVREGVDSIELETMYRKAEEMKKHLKELEKMKVSLNNDLMQMEKNRHTLLRQVEEYKTKSETDKKEIERLKSEISRGKRILDEVKQARRDSKDCPHLPQISLQSAPLSLRVQQRTLPKLNISEKSNCMLADCFDFSQCSFTSGFPVYVYENTNEDLFLKAVRDNLISSPHSTSDPSKACLFVFLGKDNTFYKETLESLHHWNGDGHNHLIFNIGNENTLTELNTGRAMQAVSSYHSVQYFRPGFDIVIPPLLFIHDLKDSPWKHAPPQLPAVRKYFLSFQGQYRTSSEFVPFINDKDLNKLSSEVSHIHFETSCNHDTVIKKASDMWLLCGSHDTRAELLKQSTYALILGPGKSDSGQNWSSTHIRLIEAIQYGAVPVILADNYILPFDDVINWKEAGVIIHEARFPELLFLLRTIKFPDLLKLRLQSRFIWETYFSSMDRIVQAILANIRTRLSIPAKPITGMPSESIFSNEGDTPVSETDNLMHELPTPSQSYTRNFTSVNSFSRQTWNHYPGALHMFPFTPFEPFLPSSAPFMNSGKGFQLIGGGEGGAGVEFSKALGGNYPKEQFTVVMLTFERELVLIEAIQRLAGLDYLHKVVVVWNSPSPPSLLLKWPDIGVPVHVVKAQENSLNNRFLPYDVIETEAILSIDDDAHLRHDEIVFGFRVWREARDRIVGFPGRFHAWDVNNGGWLYNSNYTCELSMVLTGAAFFHKFYAYVYSHIMPTAIRDKVDEFMNCEDIAMNFLVSHITRKPPIKVTTRWTFRCPGCPVALSQDETHFQERHVCINFFEKVYGYMPLIRTQFRADSVLFKTRIPHDKSKCFKYI